MENAWRHMQRDALISFAENALMPVGFGYLDAEGRHQNDHGIELWINGRFTHVMACEVLHANRQAENWLDHGIQALLGPLHDDRYDGWFRSVTTDGANIFASGDEIKEAYSHAFVVLAASSAYQAGHPQAERLLSQSLDCSNKYWWDSKIGRVRERATRDWSNFEPYRGINANMHTVESYLALYDAIDDKNYLRRALNICDFVLANAQERGWRIVEHYNQFWQPDPEFNRGSPADPFRPYGATVGHAFEWARLAIQARVMAMRAGFGQASLAEPLALIRQGIKDGWAVDGADGFVYTTDFTGKPIVHERMHWVICEAINAVHVAAKAIVELAEVTQVEADADAIAELQDWENIWWRYVENYLIESPGRWREELDVNNKLSQRTWTGMPEIYHAYQTLVLADGDYAYGFARAAKTS